MLGVVIFVSVIDMDSIFESLQIHICSTAQSTSSSLPSPEWRLEPYDN